MKINNLSFLIGFFLLFACKNYDNQYEKNGQIIPLAYNPSFKIEQMKDYKLLTIYHNQKKDSILYAFIPKKNKLPQNILTKNIIRTPIEKIVAFSHTHLACIESLKSQNSIVGVTEGSFLVNSKWQKEIESKHIFDLGVGDVSLNEKLMLLKPELIIVSNFSDVAKFSTLQKLNIQTLLNLDWLETHPLSRSEWIKVFGLLFEKEQESQEIFKNIDNQYQKNKDLVKNIAKKPTVLTDMPFKGTWYLAGGKSYMAQFLADAGGDFIGKDNQNTASIPTNIENVFTKAQKAEFWLNVGQAQTLKEVKENDQRLTEFEAFKNKKIYNYNADYWLTSLINPHEVLADLIMIFHQKSIEKNRKMKYYKQLE
jgi:iron complex transport system substrate-binding protein